LALASAVLVPLVFLFKKGSQPISGTAALTWIDHQAVRAHEWWSHRVLG
jgi:hypothetical protein